MNRPADHTSPTLLGRLRQDPADEAAWAATINRSCTKRTPGNSA
jgi:hypothetical protein